MGCPGLNYLGDIAERPVQAAVAVHGRSGYEGAWCGVSFVQALLCAVRGGWRVVHYSAARLTAGVAWSLLRSVRRVPIGEKPESGARRVGYVRLVFVAVLGS